jgi:hypothetical protein
MSHDIFISYSRVDSAFALRLVRDLKERGLEVWLDQVEIGPGENWDNEIEQALDHAKTVMVLVSGASAKSENVKNEIGAALERGKLVVPVVLAKATVPLMINRLQREDFTGDYEIALRKLLQRLSGGSRTSTLKAITPEDVARMASASAARLGLSGDSEVKPDSLSPATVALKRDATRATKTRHTVLAAAAGAVLTACVVLAFALNRPSEPTTPEAVTPTPVAAAAPAPSPVVSSPPSPEPVIPTAPHAPAVAPDPKPTGPVVKPKLESKVKPKPEPVVVAQDPAPQPEPEAAPLAAPVAEKKPMAVLCQEPNFGGLCRKITSHPNLLNAMIGNDTASSVRLGGCDAVTLCADVFHTGACATFATDVADLSSTAVGDDSASSIKCIMQTGDAPLTGPVSEE